VTETGGHADRSLRYRAVFSKKGSFLAGFPAGCSGLLPFPLEGPLPITADGSHCAGSHVAWGSVLSPGSCESAEPQRPARTCWSLEHRQRAQVWVRRQHLLNHPLQKVIIVYNRNSRMTRLWFGRTLCKIVAGPTWDQAACTFVQWRRQDHSTACEKSADQTRTAYLYFG
jgi:hypothetical protein